MPPRPTGVVTFLFTDVEGSTRLWDRDPAKAQEAVARHDALLRGVFAGHRGHVFKTVGDAFCVAFQEPADAVAAALDAQRRLGNARLPFRVRMALHRGEAQERDDDYFGPALNRVARLLSLAAGGQTLLSEAVNESVRGALEEDAVLRDLGPHRLRDLSEPERVHQVHAPGLASDFPPLSGLDAVPNNLPAPTTSLVGRDDALAEVHALLRRHRLVTLVGAGGAGKSRLALEVATGALGDHAGGAWWIELAPLSDPALVPQTVAKALGVEAQAGRALETVLAETVRGKSVLFVLDNAEHLVAAASSIARTLLEASSGTRIVATSREPLGTPGEVSWRVPSLPPPAADDLASVLRSPAAGLFVERARAVAPSFAATERQAASIAQIVRRLDGIPLAIELAAARVAALSPEQIAARLDDRFRLLTGGARTALPRQQTLRALVDWSWDALGEAERACLRRVAVFAGGWTLDAAERVVPQDGAPDVVDALSRLVGKSLVQRDDASSADPRYRLLETIRQYARDRLVESGESAGVRSRHRAWVEALAEEARGLLEGPRTAETLDRLDADQANVLAALEWCEAEGRLESALSILVALEAWLIRRGHVAVARERLTRMLSSPGLPANALAIRGQRLAATFARYAGDVGPARAHAAKALERARALGGDRVLGAALAESGRVAHWTGEVERAIDLLAEACDTERRAGDSSALFTCLGSLANIVVKEPRVERARVELEAMLATEAARRDVLRWISCAASLARAALYDEDLSRARGFYESIVTLAREVGDRLAVANAQNFLGVVHAFEERPSEAIRAFEEAHRLRERMGFLGTASDALGNLIEMHRQLGHVAEVDALLPGWIESARTLGDERRLVRALFGAARVAQDRGRFADAARLFGACSVRSASVDAPMPGEKRLEKERDDALRAALGAEAYEREVAVGRALSVEEATALALPRDSVHPSFSRVAPRAPRDR